MENSNENMKPQEEGTEKAKKPASVYARFAAVLAVVLAVLLIVALRGCQQEEEPDPTEETYVETTEESTEATEESTGPTEPVMLEYMAELYAQNPDIVAWITIEGTALDYPVMYTPDDEERYIRKDFEGNYDYSGLPFVDKDCSIDPESDNVIIYGHNLKNGKAFTTIMSYKNKSFWEEHPTIKYTTLYEERTYEIVAVFRDKVYYKSDTCFKFYQFIDAENEEDFNEAMTYYKEHSLYDTGVTAEYGDSLLSLVTCSYHTDNGRFVVIARQITDEASGDSNE